MTGCEPIRVNCYVDNKSLVETPYSSNGVDDKRLRIDLEVLHDITEKGELGKVSWVPSEKRLADCLTKRGADTKQLCAAIGKC